jgi:hypothetical protein
MSYRSRWHCAPVFSKQVTIVTALCVAVGVVAGLNPRKADAAFLTGQSVTLEVANPNHTTIVNSYGPVTVASSGTQLISTNVSNVVNFVATISDDSITFNYPNANSFANPAFNGYILQENSVSAPTFTFAAVDPASTLEGFDNSRVTFDANHVYMNVEGLSVQAGQQLVIDFNPVPEPASLSLLALAGIPLLMRRRRA